MYIIDIFFFIRLKQFWALTTSRWMGLDRCHWLWLMRQPETSPLWGFGNNGRDSSALRVRWQQNDRKLLWSGAVKGRRSGWDSTDIVWNYHSNFFATACCYWTKMEFLFTISIYFGRMHFYHFSPCTALQWAEQPRNHFAIWMVKSWNLMRGVFATNDTVATHIKKNQAFQGLCEDTQ